MFAPLYLVGGLLAERLVSYWSGREIAVLFATVALGVVIWLSERALWPRLTLVPVFALYEALLNLMLFAVALWPVPNYGYWYAYSYGAVAENFLLILLAIEITCAILPTKKLSQAWTTALALIAILSIGSSLPARTDAAVLNVTLAGDFIASLVLLSLLYFHNLRWPAGYRLIIAGVVLPSAIHAASAIHWLRNDLTDLVRAVLPLSSLGGLVLFMLGQISAKREQGKHYEALMKHVAEKRRRAGSMNAMSRQGAQIPSPTSSVRDVAMLRLLGLRRSITPTTRHQALRPRLRMGGQRLIGRQSPVFQSAYSVFRVKPGSIWKWMVDLSAKRTSIAWEPPPVKTSTESTGLPLTSSKR
jgi:hypothetical protein